MLMLSRCWISEEKGAIWAFIAPMLLIITVMMRANIIINNNAAIG